MKTPDNVTDTVNRTLSATVLKQAAVIKAQDRAIRTLRAALLVAADQLNRAGWKQSAEIAQDAAS